jgi:membrane protein implicated in regulation of membrane protease activity
MSTWWMWMALGVVRAAIEVATPGGFVVIFFAVAACVVALLSLAGAAGGPVLQWLEFSVVAVAALRLFRNPLLKHLRVRDHGHVVDAIAGETAIASTYMAPGEYGSAELRGTVWKARNVDLAPVTAGQRCRVVAVEGLLLDVCLE